MKPAIKFEISWNQETNISHFKVQTDHRHRKLHPETVPSSFPFQKDLSDPHLLFPQKNILRNQRLWIANREVMSIPFPSISLLD